MNDATARPYRVWRASTGPASLMTYRPTRMLLHAFQRVRTVRIPQAWVLTASRVASPTARIWRARSIYTPDGHTGPVIKMPGLACIRPHGNRISTSQEDAAPNGVDDVRQSMMRSYAP